MGLFDFLIYVLIAAICGGIGQSLGGYKVGSGGCLISAGIGFVGAILGKWIAVELDLPLFWTIEISGKPFPVVWSVIGAAILTGILGAVFNSRRKD
ncbi:hypothetical protein [Balneola vulgaris]|jgi:uncharacterized membrane protein YeaQ/YmgE (transglycosylase-associated protein family)|uniref:hypothetical protein n=1 Tax=Balneola vulgaris TaxID=287535 RepID=UPI00037E7127|nr:hypothetical protein [Balneola vulgaris]